jgi:FixJ family two-component response regulator
MDDIHPLAAPSPTGKNGAMSSPIPIVFVVDDDVSIRESLASLIRWAGWKPETFSSAQEFLSRPKGEVPSCLVLDIELPDLNGLDLQERVTADRADMPIIFITGYGDIPMSVRAMKAGAAEFLTKPFDRDVMLAAMRSALDRSRASLVQTAELTSLRERFASLTRREREVFAWVVSGLLNKQVGAELGMTEATVKAHRGQVMQKMKADSLADLVRIAGRLELPLPSRALDPPTSRSHS